MKSIPLVASLVVAAWIEAASAKMTAKKNSTVTAMAPRIIIAFIIMCGVVFSDLNLVLMLKKMNYRKLKGIKGESLQYLFKLETQQIAIILINIYMCTIKIPRMSRLGMV